MSVCVLRWGLLNILQAGLEFETHLPQLSKCWNYKCALPTPGLLSLTCPVPGTLTCPSHFIVFPILCVLILPPFCVHNQLPSLLLPPRPWFLRVAGKPYHLPPSLSTHSPHFPRQSTVSHAPAVQSKKGRFQVSNPELLASPLMDTSASDLWA